uniref:C-type lectin domain-containing protein n=1 Tax=Sus scrofa TaxID=9823 RepID=A0A8D1LYF9_PIG
MTLKQPTDEWAQFLLRDSFIRMPLSIPALVPLGGTEIGWLLLSLGQPVCREGTRRPCYEVIYFQESSRRLNFEEARAACGRDGGQLVSIESEDEQRLIEKFIENLHASDGDFWIGLRRWEEKQSNSTACQDLYAWTDGSTATFRNWYADEPSCGSEVCVVMYHQPSAPAGIGGRYMFQWNDDRCTMKNNFICKYSEGEGTEPATPRLPEDIEKEEATGTLKESSEAALNLAYILIPGIPLLLLLVVSTGVCWVWICRRRQVKPSSRKPLCSLNAETWTSTEAKAVPRGSPLQFFFFLFRVTPPAYENSQARGRKGAAVTAYTTATATWNPSLICNLCHSLWQCQILNPLREDRDRT